MTTWRWGQRQGRDAPATLSRHGGVALAAILLLTAPALAGAAQELSDQQLSKVGFDQKLNTQISLDLPFRDETGKTVVLGEYFGKKPVILVLGYYECPMLCTLVMNGMIQALQDIKWTIGSEFEVVNISISPAEGPSLAAAKKATYLKAYGRRGAASGWHYLTGTSNSIAQIADQVGFHFLYDEKVKQYAHPSGVVFLTPEGKVAGYRFGVAYDPKQVLDSLQQARSGKPGSPVQKLVLLCFHYNPISGKYGPAIMVVIRIMALGTILGLAWAVWKVTRRRIPKPPASAANGPSITGRVPP